MGLLNLDATPDNERSRAYQFAAGNICRGWLLIFFSTTSHHPMVDMCSVFRKRTKVLSKASLSNTELHLFSMAGQQQLCCISKIGTSKLGSFTECLPVEIILEHLQQPLS